MIFDDLLQVADEQAVTASAASTDYIDTLAAGDANVGPWFVVRCTTTADSAEDSATVTFKLQSDSASGFATNLTDEITSAAIAQASLVADTIVFKERVPAGMQRYLRGYFTVGPENLTAGAFDMFFASDADINRLLEA